MEPHVAFWIGQAKVRTMAASVLGHVGEDAGPAVPALLECLRDESEVCGRDTIGDRRHIYIFLGLHRGSIGEYIYIINMYIYIYIYV